jgi:hypothetical protein
MSTAEEYRAEIAGLIERSNENAIGNDRVSNTAGEFIGVVVTHREIVREIGGTIRAAWAELNKAGGGIGIVVNRAREEHSQSKEQAGKAEELRDGANRVIADSSNDHARQALTSLEAAHDAAADGANATGQTVHTVEDIAFKMAGILMALDGLWNDVQGVLEEFDDASAQAGQAAGYFNDAAGHDRAAASALLEMSGEV